jgi:hypothetical protein
VIAEWLAATPPPPGWDASSLVDSIPQAELTASSQVRHYLECTWIAEWAEAVRSDDQASRERAEGVLADQMSWPVFQVEIEARSRIQAQFADHIDQIDADIEDRAEQMTATRTADDVAEFERDHSCGFVKPQE